MPIIRASRPMHVASRAERAGRRCVGSLLVGFEAASSLVTCHFAKWANLIHKGRSLFEKDHVYIVIKTLLQYLFKRLSVEPGSLSLGDSFASSLSHHRAQLFRQTLARFSCACLLTCLRQSVSTISWHQPNLLLHLYLLLSEKS